MKKFLTALQLAGIVLLITQCRKANSPQGNPTDHLSKITLPQKKHPFSIDNMRKALDAISKHDTANKITIEGGSNSKRGTGTYTGIPNVNGYPVYNYFRFDPANFDATQLQAIEADSNITLMDFPFANIAIYDEAFGLDETKAEELKDGYIYAMAPAGDAVAGTLFTSSQGSILDTLVLPPDSDTAIAFQAMRQAGYSFYIEDDGTASSSASPVTANGKTVEPDLFGICLFKQPL